MFHFKSLQQFNDFFKDEKSCYDFLTQQRWKDGVICPHCQSQKVYVVKSRSKDPELKEVHSYRCGNRECDMPFTAKVGTIFEGCKIPLRKFFLAIYEITTSKKGISSIELATRLSITQKSAWFVAHRVREMLKEMNPELLDGIVEVDETYVGGSDKNRHENKKGTKEKVILMGYVERGGKVRTTIIPNIDMKTFHSNVLDNVSTMATLITDAHHSYKTLHKHFDNHEIVKKDHSTHKTDRHFHTNNIEGFWSHLKRGIDGTHHFVSPKHLHRYCTEFSSRYNYRKQSNLDRFMIAIDQCDQSRLTYANLIKKAPTKEDRIFRL